MGSVPWASNRRTKSGGESYLTPVTAMPWNADHDAPSMSHLREPVREEPIATANALFEERMEKGRAIRISINRAPEQTP